MVSLGYLWLILTAGAPMPPATTALPSSDEMHCNILCDGTLDTLEKSIEEFFLPSDGPPKEYTHLNCTWPDLVCIRAREWCGGIGDEFQIRWVESDPKTEHMVTAVCKFSTAVARLPRWLLGGIGYFEKVVQSGEKPERKFFYHAITGE